MAKAKAKVNKGAKLVCIPCGRQIVISDAGISRTTIWCCGKPMAKKSPMLLKKIKAKLSKKKKK